MANTVTNVTTGKPNVGGAIWRAPYGTALPADATTALNEAFKCLGYCSEDGMTNNNSPSKENVKAWGGDVVLTTTTEKLDTFAYTLIEAVNVDVLKSVYGDDNVSGTFETGITVRANSDEQEPSSYIVELKIRGGKKRIVIPYADLSELAEIAYQDNNATGYGVTIMAMAGGFGAGDNDTHKEYIIKV